MASNTALKLEKVAIECPNCGTWYCAVLSNRAPRWKQSCLECDAPFGMVRGQHVYALFPPCARE
jgi:hypothetical protein